MRTVEVADAKGQDQIKGLAQSMFEINISDEFLPIYTHPLYARLFRDNSSLVHISPDILKLATRNTKQFGEASVMGASMVFSSGVKG